MRPSLEREQMHCMEAWYLKLATCMAIVFPLPVDAAYLVLFFFPLVSFSLLMLHIHLVSRVFWYKIQKRGRLLLFDLLVEIKKLWKGSRVRGDPTIYPVLKSMIHVGARVR